MNRLMKTEGLATDATVAKGDAEVFFKVCGWLFLSLADLCALLWGYDRLFISWKGDISADHFAMRSIPFCLLLSLACMYFSPPYFQTKVHWIYWCMFGG